MRDPDSIDKDAIIFKLLAIYNTGKSNLMFPVASCMSHGRRNNHSAESDLSETESLSVPGIQIKRRAGVDYQNVNELEINEWLVKETGMDRIRSMYALGKDGQFVREETQLMNTMWLRTVLVGFCINMVSMTLAKNKKKKHLSMTAAIEKEYNSQAQMAKTAWRDVFKSTFRLSVWAGSLIYISQTVAAYRNKTSVWEYVIASAVGFGCVGLPGGVKKIATFSAIGVALGFIGGHAICKVMTDNSFTQETRHTRYISQVLQNGRLAQGESSMDADDNEDTFS